MAPSLRRVAIAVAAGVMILTAGCGARSASIRGKVTLDGKAVENGLISFVPVEGTTGPSAGATITQGEFDVRREPLPVAGKYRVEIKSQRKTGKKVAVGSPAPPGTMADETVEAIPSRYNLKSTLREELKVGENVFNFDLSSGEK